MRIWPQIIPLLCILQTIISPHTHWLDLTGGCGTRSGLRRYKKWIKTLLQLNQSLNAGHTEFLMMKKFKLLVKKFKLLDKNYNKPVKYIILYSYLLPCKLCASVIVDTIQSCYSAESKPLTKIKPLTYVLYSGKWKHDLEEDSTKKMESNGIKLHKIYLSQKNETKSMK